MHTAGWNAGELNIVCALHIQHRLALQTLYTILDIVKAVCLQIHQQH
jgi:hypothetical protein